MSTAYRASFSIIILKKVTICCSSSVCYNISRVSDQNGLSPLYIMLEIHHSGREPSNYASSICIFEADFNHFFRRVCLGV